MNKSWNKIKEIILQLRGLTTIGITDVLANAISSIFWFYMASVLGAEHYGQISYFLAIAGITSTISLTGAGNMLTVYSAKNVKIEPPVYFISIITGFIASIILFFAYSNLGISVYNLGAVIFGLASSEILGKKLYKNYSKYLISQKILMVVFSIGFYYLIGIDGVILGIAISFFLYSVRIYKGFKGSRIDFSIIKSRFGFMINSYILNLSSAFSGSIDKLIIMPILGFTLLGNYQLGLQFLALLHILPAMVYKYTLPQDASGNPNKKLKKITILASIILATVGVSLSPLIVPMIFPKFTAAIGVIQIISLSIIPISINLMYESKFLGGEKSKVVLINSGVYILVQVVSILLLGKLYGINGVAAAFVLASSVQTISYLIINRLTKRNELKSF